MQHFGGDEMLKTVEERKAERDSFVNLSGKDRSILGCALFALVVFPPFGTLLASCFGFRMALAGVPAFAGVAALRSVIMSI